MHKMPSRIPADISIPQGRAVNPKQALVGQDNRYAMQNTLIQYKQLGQIFDLLSLGVIILAPDRKITSMNRFAEMLTCRKEEEMTGEYCYLHFKDYLCGGNCKYLEKDEALRDAMVTEVTFYDESRQELSLMRIESPIYDSANRIVGCMEIFQDQSIFKKLIRRIRYDDKKLRMILDNLDLGVLSLDRSNHVLFFNQMAEIMTGFSRNEILGKPCTKLFPKHLCGRWAPSLKKNTDQETKIEIEGEMKTRSSQNIPASIRYMSMKDENGQSAGGLITVNDLSLLYQLEKVIHEKYTCEDMVGRSPSMQRLFETLPVIAKSNATVLIEGPTGTGKDLLARIIHNKSLRKERPFVKVNCASLPDTLLESEMFGYVKGAFTGADRDKPGRFQQADSGTLFLDEIGDLPLSLQAKLLRVLEDREFYALGSAEVTRVNVRIICATNQDLAKKVGKKQFREDLYYRINVMRMEIPPIWERRNDLPLLISHTLKRLCVNRNIPVPEVTREAMEILMNHDYPGNVRELQNILEHALIISLGKEIDMHHLPVSLHKKTGNPQSPVVEHPGEPEHEKILRILEKHRGNKTKTAKEMNVNRTTLWRKLKKYQIRDE